MPTLNIYSKEQIDNKVQSINNSINGINEDITGINESITNLQSSKQNKLTAGTGISINANNVISSTVNVPVKSVNSKTGAVVLTGVDIKVNTGNNQVTIADKVSTIDSNISSLETSKQDKISITLTDNAYYVITY